MMDVDRAAESGGLRDELKRMDFDVMRLRVCVCGSQ